MANNKLTKRFDLNDGQFFAETRLKNQHWFLNDVRFGFGDLRDTDLFRIQELLYEEEVFKGYNEHHMSMFMQRQNPMVVVNNTSIDFPEFEPVSEATREEIRRG